MEQLLKIIQKHLEDDLEVVLTGYRMQQPG